MHITPKQLALAGCFIAPCCFDLAAANVGKAIFVLPSLQPIPAESPAIDDLGLKRLSPGNSMLRTNLDASFPTHAHPYGTESWLYLQDLNPGQRYEVRICWPATQPTSFTLTTHSHADTVSEPGLLSALIKFSETQLAGSIPKSSPSNDDEHEAPGLFLRIQSAADYFTTNSTLMENVPPVTADIILDPFIANVLPRSLAPAAIYIVLVAVLVYYIGTSLANALSVTSPKAKVKKNV